MKKKTILYGWWQKCGMMNWHPNDDDKDELRFIPMPVRLKKDLLQLVGFGYGAKRVKITIEEI